MKEATKNKLDRFIQLYLQTGNTLSSAKSAGYGGKDTSLRVMASRLIRHPYIMAKLSEIKEKSLKNAGEDLMRAGSSPTEIVERIDQLARYGKTQQVQLQAWLAEAKMKGLLTEKVEMKSLSVYSDLTYPSFAEKDDLGPKKESEDEKVVIIKEEKTGMNIDENGTES